MKKALLITLTVFVLIIVVKVHADTKQINFEEYWRIRASLGNPPVPMEGETQEERFITRCLALAEVAESKGDDESAGRLRELARDPYKIFPTQESFADRCLSLAEVAKTQGNDKTAGQLREVARDPNKIFNLLEAQSETRQPVGIEVTEVATPGTEEKPSEQDKPKSVKTYWFESVFMSAILAIPFFADLVY